MEEPYAYGAKLVCSTTKALTFNKPSLDRHIAFGLSFRAANENAIAQVVRASDRNEEHTLSKPANFVSAQQNSQISQDDPRITYLDVFAETPTKGKRKRHHEGRDGNQKGPGIEI